MQKKIWTENKFSKEKIDNYKKREAKIVGIDISWNEW